MTSFRRSHHSAPTVGLRTLACGATLLALAGAIWLWPLASGSPAGVAEAQQAPSRPLPTERLCRACHLDRFVSTAAGPHSVLDLADWRDRYDVELSCTACHGDVAEHIAAGGRAPVFAFGEASPVEQSAVCLGCHRATHPGFDSSPHARAGLTCTSCHSQHASDRRTPLLADAAPPPGLERLGSTSAVCVDCHAETVSLFALNEHHRLREGILECTSCHDPHAPAARATLGGFKQQACTECHADKGGPFVFEHEASRVEGCTVCHNPHGSPNRHMLAHERPAELCFSCHAAVPQFHAGFSPVGPPRFNLDTQCTNCHSAIHGSNLSPFFLQ